ncbi:MAG: hypothetical protein JST68_21985 [Bacteroidetes bacterium]|nr:hypothetical protein [Bacteroidota bacterium]
MKKHIWPAFAFITLAGCNNAAPSSDATPPTIYLLKWERTAAGTQGAQTQIKPGGTFTVPQSWLGLNGATNKADIRIYADDKEGVSLLEVTGASRGVCSTNPDRNGVIYTSSGALNASFPTQTEKTNPGIVRLSMTIHLDGFLADGSCGTHQFANMPSSQPFFLNSGTWTITARAANCCGGITNATFTITVQ